LGPRPGPRLDPKLGPKLGRTGPSPPRASAWGAALAGQRAADRGRRCAVRHAGAAIATC